MLTIGEFSKLCKVSPKALRYYDSIDLLKPAFLNKDNDYRYYTIEQLDQVLLINKLKEYQFPLVEILNILKKNNDEYLMECISQKQKEIEFQIERQKCLLKQMNNDIEVIRNGGKLISINEDIDIKLVDTESMRIVSVRRAIKESETGQLFNDLIPIIDQFKLKVYGSPITIYHDKEYDESRVVDMEIGVPVWNGDNKYTRILEGSLCIYTRYVGNYKELVNAIKALYVWKENKGYEIIMQPYQKYIKGIGDTDNPDEYITEIYIPVVKR
ncbi:MerR family transcriptional regulator [Clostridium folliculivorans]|uniref:MerR family transcriptional regulator n=1 Tax=Clostridium folliculivorans TaxID=2886038 RepID=A0A9W6DCH7_9CLOT|nr:MerR family transcriptional regulator [Clostridium folliculivorans]GKU27510.1 MerR family transcriptional regulator [Clostridium folliculivorans]GKU32360.1 MerR family transcriptional regulator [Clostridium folliculivorans]